jgi:chemotaxis protein methyltransferase CheR
MRSSDDMEVRSLLDAIYEGFHYDFRKYSMASLKRRLDAALPRLGCATLPALQDRLAREPRTFDKLLQYLTVQVSDLFRDPVFFRRFREWVVPELSTYPSLRLWVAGCSTGEEAYSFAILLREEGLLDRSLIYATDINGRSLELADAGVYAIHRLPSFTENHRESGAKNSLSEHYTAAYGGALFDRGLRARIVFSDHSLATDSVFAEVQVVSCRNTLIYFNRELQDRALGLFQGSLCRRGFLGLGSQETLDFSAHALAFHPRSGPDDTWYRRC